MKDVSGAWCGNGSGSQAPPVWTGRAPDGEDRLPWPCVTVRAEAHLSGTELPFDAVVRDHLRSTRPAIVPEIETVEAAELVPLWNALDGLDGGAGEPPYWAFSWPGSPALARHLLDHPAIVRGRTVLDVGAGNGLASVACAIAGASRVVANDVDPWSLRMAETTAHVNGVAIEIDGRDRLDEPPEAVPFDVVLVGDLFYARGLAARAERFVRGLAAAGREVLIGEPGRDYALRDGWQVEASIGVPVSAELERARAIVVRVLRMTGPHVADREPPAPRRRTA